MTLREFYNNVINGKIDDDTIAVAKGEIEKLDARNDKRRNTLSKEQIANEGIKEQILAYLEGKTKVVASEIATSLSLSTQKVSSLCRQLVDSKKVTVEDIKVTGKGYVKGYTLA